MGFDIATTTTFVTVACCRCSALFALPEHVENQLRETHDAFYCPNGHILHFYGETSDLARARRDLAAERARHDQTKADRDYHARRVIAYRGQLTKTKRRIANGVCPCCTRTFQNLARHMAAKHPHYKEEQPT